MENIIRKAIEGGFEETAHISDERQWFVFMYPNFWKALGKSCNWGQAKTFTFEFRPTGKMEMYKWYALEFHRINLTQSFEEATKWLEDLIKEK